MAFLLIILPSIIVSVINISVANGAFIFTRNTNINPCTWNYSKSKIHGCNTHFFFNQPRVEPGLHSISTSCRHSIKEDKNNIDAYDYGIEYDYSKFNCNNKHTFKMYDPNKKLRNEFQKHGILYKKSILSPIEFQTIKDEISSIPSSQLQNEKLNTVARKRIGMTLDKNSEIVRLLSCENGSIHKFLNDVATVESSSESRDGEVEEEEARDKSNIVMSKDVPVEVSACVHSIYFDFYHFFLISSFIIASCLVEDL